MKNSVRALLFCILFSLLSLSIFSQPGVGLPIWPLAVGGGGDAQTVDWTSSSIISQSIPGTAPSQTGGAGAAFDHCGNLLFYVIHTGAINVDNNLFIYAADGTALLTNTTPNAPGLSGCRSDNELQVVRVPGANDEWYIIHSDWNTDTGSPYGGSGSYTPTNVLFSRVQYSGSNLNVVYRDSALTVNSSTYNYTHGKAVSRTTPNPLEHYLYLCRRSPGVNFISLDRFVIDSVGISWDANTGNIPSTWWSLTISGSPIELSPTEDRIAVVNRNQSHNYNDITIINANLFSNSSFAYQAITLSDLILQPDGITQINAMSISQTANSNSSLMFLAYLERKVGSIEFSPNGRFLYFCNGGYVSSGYTNLTYLGQIDLGLPSGPATYPYDVRLQIQDAPGTVSMTTGKGGSYSSYMSIYHSIGSLQASYDGNLYFTKRSMPNLFVIPEPDMFMPQMLIPGVVDLSNLVEPNIIINGLPGNMPDQIDGYNYLEFTPVDFYFGDDTLACQGAILTLDATTPNATYLWQDNSTDSLIQVTTAGTYWVEVNVNNCYTIDTINVDFIELQYNLGNDTLICSGDTLVLDVTNPETTYLWQDNSVDSIYSISQPGTYWVEMISSQCLYGDTIVVSMYDITSDFITSDLLCLQDEVSLTYTGNASTNAIYNWTYSSANYISGSGQGPIDLNWTNPGSYEVGLSVSEGVCFSDTTIFTIINPEGIGLSIYGSDTICSGSSTGEILVTPNGGSGMYSYLWNMGNTTNNLSGVQAGVYTVTVTYNLVCEDTISYSIYDQGSPLIGEAVSSGIACYGDTSANIDLSVSGGTPPYLYSWNIGGINNQDLDSVAAGYYSVTIYDSYECETVTSINIDEPSELIVTTSMDTFICEGQSSSLFAYASGGFSPYTFNWINNGTGDSIFVTPLESTDYFVQVIDSNNCVSNIGVVTVSLFPEVSPIVSATSDSICLGDSTVIFANFEGGNGGPYTCFLDGEEIEVPFLIFPFETTSYTIEGFDDCGSPASSVDFTIVVLDIPLNTISADVIEGCVPLSVQFTNEGSSYGESYLWFFGEEEENCYSIAENPQHIFEFPGAYDVSLRTTSPFGCEFRLRIHDMINVSPGPKADFMIDRNSVGLHEPNVYFTNLTYPYCSSFWNFGDGSTYTGFNESPWHAYSDTGTYYVTLIVESDSSCFDTLSIPIVVTAEEGFYVPNAIVLNGTSESNGVFRPSIYGVRNTDYHLVIFNRWGEKIFESFDYYHGWDGKGKNGNPVSIGGYAWVIIYKDHNGIAKKEAGNVLVIK